MVVFVNPVNKMHLFETLKKICSNLGGLRVLGHLDQIGRLRHSQ